MKGSRRPRIEPVSLDVANARLWRGPRSLALRPKDLTVLQVLAEQPGQLVTKERLVSAAWPGVFVTEAVLKASINRVRAALDDDAGEPRFIETVHRRGYRLIGEIALGDGVAAARPLGSGRVVGRAAELDALARWLEQAAAGQRQVVFISGEAGLGKTTLVDAFVETRLPKGARVGRGQCIEHYGGGEAYMPMLEALGRLCRGAGGPAIVALLARHAPSWLAQMPGLLPARRAAGIRRRTAGTTRDRMLRELADTMEIMARSRPVVLVLEDLHWSDASTLDAITTLARRRDPARLLVLATFRPEEALSPDRPLPALVRELGLHHFSAELPLSPLTEAAVDSYLRARLRGAPVPPEVVETIYRRTEGHPLFLVAMAEQWENEPAPDALARAVPPDVRRLIEARLYRLGATDRRLVEAASVAGVDFSTASVAAGLGESVADVDDGCAALARRRLLLRSWGEERWPDGTVAGRYGFLHALYREVIAAQLPVARRVELHRRVAVREEAGHGAEAGKIAARLAMHFEQGQDHATAGRYRLEAAHNAVDLGGYREAIAHATAGLHLLGRLAESPQRAEQELGLELVLATALAMTQGYAAPGATRAYARVLALGRAIGATPESALRGVYLFHLVRGELGLAQDVAQQGIDQAARAASLTPALWAHACLGVALVHRGEMTRARADLEEALGTERPRETHLIAHRHNHEAVALSYLAWCLWMLGYPEQAAERNREALEVAAHPLARAQALTCSATLHRFRGDVRRAWAEAREAVDLATEHGLAHWRVLSTMMRGWGQAMLGKSAAGIAEIQGGLLTWRAMGAEYVLPISLTLLAEALGKAGQGADAQAELVSAAAVAEKTGERLWEPEIHRLRGELLLRSMDALSAEARREALASADAAFQQALTGARAQQARSLELRAAISLCRLARHTGGREPALSRLADLYGWFTEGFRDPDLREARAVLDGGQ